jgi:hypothetical protein
MRQVAESSSSRDFLHVFLHPSFVPICVGCDKDRQPDHPSRVSVLQRGSALQELRSALVWALTITHNDDR